MRAMKELQQGGLLNPGAKLAKQKVGTGKRLTPQERVKLRKQRERELRRKKREERNKQ
jgi:signal recognition particle subunit SRP54